MKKKDGKFGRSSYRAKRKKDKRMSIAELRRGLKEHGLTEDDLWQALRRDALIALQEECSEE
ncbi:MAG: hypothetical protein ABIH38_03705 [Patescibacteria group bacterium]